MTTSLDIMKLAIDKRLFATERHFRVTILIIFADCSLLKPADELYLFAPDYVHWQPAVFAPSKLALETYTSDGLVL